MSISDDTVRHIAHLARVKMQEEQIPSYCQTINKILDFIAQMNAIDTTGVLPLAHALGGTQRTRPDQVTAGNQRDTLLALSEHSEQGLFLVPKVIE